MEMDGDITVTVSRIGCMAHAGLMADSFHVGEPGVDVLSSCSAIRICVVGDSKCSLQMGVVV